jgi:hypothetical protein
MFENKQTFGGHEAEPCPDPVSFFGGTKSPKQARKQPIKIHYFSKPTTIFAH